MLTSILHVEAHTIQDPGAAALRQVVDSQDLPGVLKVYLRGINYNFYLAAAASTTTLFLAFVTGLHRIG